jgi:hypothetical protein
MTTDDEEGAVHPPNGVWKWIAAVLVAVMLAGAPSIIQAVKAPSQEEVDAIRERQVQVLIRLAGIDEQLQTNEGRLIELQEALMEHQRIIEEQGGAR